MKKILIGRSKPKAIMNSQLIEINNFFKEWILKLSDKDSKTDIMPVFAEEVIDKKITYKEIFKQKEHFLTQAQIQEVVTCHFPKQANKLLFRYHDYVVVVKRKDDGTFLFDADRLEHSAPIKYNEDVVFYITPEKIAS